MITRERVLAVLKANGPSLPVQIKKALGEGDTFTVGAVLTELRAAGLIRISTVKRGGSPFYYLPEHRGRLVNFLSDLGEKEGRAARLLQEQRVLNDHDQDPLVRVCLRQIKDYALPVEVKTKDGETLFWKWFDVSNTEAETLIRKALGVPEPKPPEPVKTSPAQAADPVVPEMPTPVVHKPIPLPAEKTPVQQVAQPAAKVLKEVDDTGDDFLKDVLAYFAEKHIQVVDRKVVRKNAEVEFVVSLPTAVGRVEYYCKAKNKKRSNDGDLSSAYVQGQLKKLPVLYLAAGEVTKKAKEMLAHEFKGMVLVQL